MWSTSGRRLSTRVVSRPLYIVVQVVVDKMRFHKMWKVLQPGHLVHVMLYVVTATVMSLCLSRGSSGYVSVIGCVTSHRNILYIILLRVTLILV